MRRFKTGPWMMAVAGAVALAGCGGEGLSTADVQTAAKERVRDQLGLTEASALFTDTFVGQPLNGDTVICGTVEGTTADGATITPRRFIAATDPARWVKFEPVTDAIIPSRPQKFIEWDDVCVASNTD